MVVLELKLSNQRSALDFLRIVKKYDFKVDARMGCCILDAKSALGILGISIGRSFQLRAYTDDRDRLERDLEVFLANPREMTEEPID